MIGAIIGDLAAWTYEHDKSLFYSKLIHPEAKLSVSGLAVLSMFELMTQKESDVDWKEIKSCFKRTYPLTSNDVANIPDVWTEFLRSDGLIPEEVKRVMNVATDIVGGWCEHPRDTAMAWGVRFHGMKEEYYLSQISDVIYRLRQGATKKEAIKGTSYITDWYKPKHGETDVSPLGYACLAWHCFKDSFDFTSAIHNAMRCPYGEKHLLATLVGATAEAMYGCGMMILKKKFCPNGDCLKTIELPRLIDKSFDYSLNIIRNYEREKRKFFPKNSATTNVERHTWERCEFPILYAANLTSEDLEKIRISDYTSWENRYGIYLDDGWFYCYRSQYLLLRFKLTEDTYDHTYHIDNVELSGERSHEDCLIGLDCALTETCRVELPTEFRNYVYSIRFCSIYYKGESEAPKHLSDEEKCYWWMEQQYYCHRFPYDKQREKWERDAQTICLEDKEIVDFMKNDKIPITIKGMIAFTIQDFLYHAPMGGAREAYAFAKVIEKRYK